MVGPPELGMQDLLDLARDKSVSGRTRLVQVVGDLFFDEHHVLNERERALMTDILRQLIHDVEMSVRKALADRLAVHDEAPHELITTLANDQIEVAHNILLNSQVLQDIELIEIIQHRTFEHQLAIAMRRSVSEAVSDALVETGNTTVIQRLIENPAAKIAPNTMDFLVGESKGLEAFQKPLLERPDLSPHLAKRMYWWVSAALRQHIIEHYKVDPTELDQKIEETIKDILGEPVQLAPGGVGTIDERSLDQASQLARKLKEKNSITPQLLLQTLRRGEVQMFEGLFSQLTGLRPMLVRRLVFEPGGEGLAIACKAVEMSKPDFGSIFLMSRSARPGDKVVDPTEVARVMRFFDRIQRPTAQKVVARWKLDPDYLFAIKQVENAAGKKTDTAASAAR